MDISRVGRWSLFQGKMGRTPLAQIFMKAKCKLFLISSENVSPAVVNMFENIPENLLNSLVLLCFLYLLDYPWN